MLFPRKLFVSITQAVAFGATIVAVFFSLIQSTYPDCYLLNRKNMYIPTSYTLSVRKALNEVKQLRLPVNSSIIRPFLRAKAWYRLAPRYNLNACIIEKSLCTLLQSIFCYLYNPVGFVENNRTISSEKWKGRFCFFINEAESTRDKDLAVPFDPPTLLMVRDPYERLISGFINTCIQEGTSCYGCRADFLCVVEGVHAEYMRMNADHWDVTIPKHKLLFPTNIPVFGTYINQTYEGRHFLPSVWNCDLYEESDNTVFIKYGETDDALNKTFTELVQLFEAHGVTKDKIDYILEGVKTRTLHATKHSGLREQYFQKLKSSPKHVQLLNDLYFYDNQIFGFEPLKANV